jgi:hypothetical protein
MLHGAFLPECLQPCSGNQDPRSEPHAQSNYAQESRDAADKKARAIVDDLRASKMNTAADLVEQSVHETLTYYVFPDIPMASRASTWRQGGYVTSQARHGQPSAT